MKTLSDVILWKNFRFSLIIFISGFVFLVLTLFYSLMSVLTSTLLYISLTCLAAKLYVHLMGFLKKPCVDILVKLDSEYFSVNEAALEEMSREYCEKLILFLSEFRSLLFVHDFEKSSKFAVLLYMLSYLGKISDQCCSTFRSGSFGSWYTSTSFRDNVKLNSHNEFKQK